MNNIASKNPTTEVKNLSIEILKSVDCMKSMKEEWDRFIEDAESDIYFTVDWLETWLTYYGQNVDMCSCIIRNNANQIVAILPFGLEKMRAGLVSIRLARLAGSYGTIAVFSPAIWPGYEVDVLKLVLETLFSKEKCDAVSLSPLSGISSLSLLEEKAHISGDVFEFLQQTETGIHTVFELPDNFDAFISAMGKSRKKKYLYEDRSLTKKFAAQNRVVEGADAIEYLDVFEDFHAKLWQENQKAGHFGDWPDSLEFNRELIRKMAPQGRVKFYELASGDRLLSAGYSFELGRRSFNRLTARDPSPDLRKFSLGRLGYIKILEILIGEGKVLEETGPGHYDYKTYIGGRECQMKRLVYVASSPLAKYKTHLYSWFFDTFHFLYYRLWFLKLAPKLGRKPKPLWKTWIRMRL